MLERSGAAAAAWAGCWTPGVRGAFKEGWPERRSVTESMQTPLVPPPTAVYHPWKCRGTKWMSCKRV